MKKTIVAIAAIAIISGAAWYWFKRKKTSAVPVNSLEALNKNLSETNLIKDNKIQVLVARGKYTAIFYDNGRFAIFQTGQKAPKFKGTYENAGMDFKMDDGRVISTGSVWNNLTNVIK